jgi:excisionase family DNA binding protein
MLPDPAERPTLEVWPETAQILGISRQLAYDGVRDGSIPAFKIGSRWLVKTAELRRKLGLDGDHA